MLASVPALADVTADQRCVNGGDVRRIEIRFADDEGSLPCRVIYRPEADSETIGIVSWQDIESVPACQAQADEVVQRLTLEGWSCSNDDIAADKAVALAHELPPSDTYNSAEVTAPIEAAIGDLKAGTTTDRVTHFVENSDVDPPSEDLVELIESNLSVLSTSIDGRLEAKIAGYGDLNADEVDDALVLYTYTSPQPAYRQFLAAYVFDGETYQLTATRAVGSHISATRNAQLEVIDGGVVHLSLQAFEPGDPSCCPSGTRYIALALQELDLVQIDADTPTR